MFVKIKNFFIMLGYKLKRFSLWKWFGNLTRKQRILISSINIYGAIFDGCKFTADEGVGGTAEKPAKTAIGRPWGAYAAVAIINSEIGGHISTVGYSTSKNERYVAMTGLQLSMLWVFVFNPHLSIHHLHSPA